METKKCLIEWVSSETVRTYQQGNENRFELMRPHGKDVFKLEASTGSYVAYWKDWIGRSGYKEGEEADICFVYLEEVEIQGVINAAKDAGVNLRASTTWSLGEILRCIKRGGACAEDFDMLAVPPIQIKLDDGRSVWLQNGCGKPFFADEDGFLAGQDKDPLPSAHPKSNAEEEDQPSTQASLSEIRDAMRRKSMQQCRSIDPKR